VLNPNECTILGKVIEVRRYLDWPTTCRVRPSPVLPFCTTRRGAPRTRFWRSR